MTYTSLTQVDLRDLALHLQRAFGSSEPVGAVVGRTQLRDAVVIKLECSQLQAEELVDSMVAEDLLIFEGEPGEPGVWHIRPPAEVSPTR